MRKSILILILGYLVICVTGAACSSEGAALWLKYNRIEQGLLEAMDYGTAALATNQASDSSFIRQKSANTALSAIKIVRIHRNSLVRLESLANPKAISRIHELMFLGKDVETYCSVIVQYIQTTSPPAKEKYRQRILALYYKIKEGHRGPPRGKMI